MKELLDSSMNTDLNPTSEQNADTAHNEQTHKSVEDIEQ